jgi:hypothetical protein
VVRARAAAQLTEVDVGTHFRRKLTARPTIDPINPVAVCGTTRIGECGLDYCGRGFADVAPDSPEGRSVPGGVGEARRPVVLGRFFALTVLGFVRCIFGFADCVLVSPPGRSVPGGVVCANDAPPKAMATMVAAAVTSPFLIEIS